MADSNNAKQDIFKEEVVPLLDNYFDALEQGKAKEREAVYNNPFLLVGGNAARLGIERNLQQTGFWNSHTLDNVVDSTRKILEGRGINVDAVIEKQMIDYFIAREMPKGKVEYVMNKILDGNPLLDTRRSRTDLEAHVHNEAMGGFEENASRMVRYGTEAASITVNVASLGPLNELSLPIMLAVSTGLDNAVKAVKSDGSQDNYLAKQREIAASEVEEAINTDVNIPKWMLTNIDISRISEASDEHLKKAFVFARANAAYYESIVNEAVQNGHRTVNVNKEAISFEEAQKTEGTFEARKFGEETSVYDATILCKQYAAFCDALLKENQKRAHAANQSEYIAKSVSGIGDEGKEMQWYNQINDFNDATGYLLEVKDGHLYYPGFMAINGKGVQSLPDNLVVDGFLDLRGSGIKELPHDLKVKGGIYNFNGHDYPPTEAMMDSDGYIDLKKAGVPLSAVPAPEPHKEDAPELEAKPEKTDEDKRDQQSAPDYNGWNYFTDAFGFSGMGETMSHLGLTLAHLPDVISGIFSGKSSLGLNKGTLLPLAAILLGTQSSNPILKFSLIALGASSLFNKAGKETLANYRGEADTRSTQMQQQTRYRQYEDEELNPRITNPHIEGNVLVVDIDHTPRIVTLPPSVTEAYQSGVIPLNTLANRILEKTERMQQAAVEAQQDASQQYDRSQDQERGRGIR